MASKTKRRRVWVPLPPRGLRPKLKPDQVRDLSLVHLTNLDLMVKGQGNEALMWQVAEQTLIWSRVSQLTGHLQEEMYAQLLVVAEVVRRFGRTGRVGFSGSEYQTAKLGIEVMDALAEVVEQHVAIEAAVWADTVLDNLRTHVQLEGLFGVLKPPLATGLKGWMTPERAKA